MVAYTLIAVVLLLVSKAELALGRVFRILLGFVYLLRVILGVLLGIVLQLVELAHRDLRFVRRRTRARASSARASRVTGSAR